MAHYAFLDENNVVTEVIVGKDESGFDWEMYYAMKRGQNCKRTSYNTFEGKHLQGGTPFRKNYAGKGFLYDAQRDAFIPPKPFQSWLLDEEKCAWYPPISMPNDGNDYEWNESTQQWVQVENQESAAG